MRWFLVFLTLMSPATAQDVEIFIPNKPKHATPVEPKILNRLAACLANPGEAACAGVVAGQSSGVTNETSVVAPDVQFETLVLDLNDGNVTSTPAPPPSQVDYSAPVKNRAVVTLPAVAITIEFEFDSDAIRYSQLDKIAELTRALRDPALSSYSFAVIGHTDAKGSARYNCKLSERRASRVVAVLKGNDVNVPLYAVGFGEHVLKDAYNPQASANRRVTFLRLPEDAVPVLDVSYQLCG